MPENIKQLIITGPMGAGKSTLINSLRHAGINCIDEPAREIIHEQRSIKGRGVYDSDPELFYQLMLSRAVGNYRHYANQPDLVVWDRGIADNIAYANLFNIDASAAQNAATLYRYHPGVLYLPAWKEIYRQEGDRQMTFEDSKAFGEQLKTIYQQLGYRLIEVPLLPPQERTAFVINNINKLRF